MAIYANEITPETEVGECSLVDHETPICSRVAFAQKSRGNLQWWRNELERANDEGPLMQQFMLLALYRFAAIDVVISLSDLIGHALDNLSRDRWRELADVAVRRWRQRVNRRARSQVKASALPTSMSPRLASLLINQVNSASSRIIFDRFLSGYRNDDRAVLTAIVDTVTRRALNDPEQWSTALPKIAHAYSHNVIFSWPYFFRHPRRSGRPVLPLRDAREICANATIYPLTLVGRAEARLTEQTGEEAIPVGKIAAKDEWFVEG
jgi:hypothetical protein